MTDDQELIELIADVLFGEQPMTKAHPEKENLDNYNKIRIENGEKPVTMEFFLKRKQRFQPVAPLIMLNPDGTPKNK